MNSRLIQNLIWVFLSLIYLFYARAVNEVVFLNVGLGYSILVQYGNTQLFIDGGPDSSVLYGIQKYMPIYDRNIEYVLLTHPHDDHLLGLLKVLDRYSVGEILYYPVCFENENYKYFFQKYENKREVGRGDTISLGYVRVNMLWPILNKEESKNGCVRPYDGNINNDSIVIEFEYLGKRFLLMGDAEQEVEKILVEKGFLQSNNGYDILKAGITVLIHLAVKLS
jgi:competence protein ComEC